MAFHEIEAKRAAIQWLQQEIAEQEVHVAAAATLKGLFTSTGASFERVVQEALEELGFRQCRCRWTLG